ncbi:MAG: hypothetical protein OWR62_16515, partial [Sulfobacillus thermotolerans]|nr:hypothetical protein [Sulfobacillus thermotolerans]
RRSLEMIRFALGSVLGILGFGTISLALFPFRAGTFFLGIGELGIGTVLALAVMAPVRRKRQNSEESLPPSLPHDE